MDIRMDFKVKLLLLIAALIVIQATYYIHANAEEVTYGDFTYEVVGTGGQVSIKKYNGSDTSVIIPNKIDGKEVYSIGARAFVSSKNLKEIFISEGVKCIYSETFRECTDLEKVKIEDGLTYIGDRAFSYCNKLHEINLPDTIEKIDEYAFFGCSELESIDLPSKLIEIGKAAFNKCEKIKEVTLSSSVSSICDYAFYDCKSLESVKGLNGNINVGKAAFDNTLWIDGLGEWIDEFYIVNGRLVKIKSGTYEELTIPDNVICIGENAFEYCDVKRVIIPASVNEIEDYAFAHSKLEEITLPSTISKLGDRLFQNCSSLENANVYTNYVSSFMFYECKKLKNVYLSSNVEMIGESAFRGCYSLLDVELSEGLKEIGYAAFMKCEELMSITIPEGVITIKSGAFDYCKKLTDIVIPTSAVNIDRGSFLGSEWYTKESKKYDMFIINNVLINGTHCKGDVVIPQGVTTIGSGAFESGDSDIPCEIKTVTIPNSVTQICSRAFAHCWKLKQIEIPNSVIKIGRGAFFGAGVKKIKLPESINIIEENTFAYSALEYIDIPDSVKEIEPFAFEETKWLRIKQSENPFVIMNDILIDATFTDGNVEVPDSVKSIVNYSFYRSGIDNSNVISRISVPKNVTYLGKGSLCNISLKQLILPENISYIDDEVGFIKSNVVIVAPADSYAEKWAKEHYVQVINDVGLLEDLSDGRQSAARILSDEDKEQSDSEEVEKKEQDSSPIEIIEQHEKTLDEINKGNSDSENVNNGETMVEGDNLLVSEVELQSAISEGAKFSINYMTYKVSSVKNGTASFISSNNKKSSISIPDTVKIDGKTYKVSKIEGNAFKNNTKLKRVKIGSNIAEIGNGAFQGCKNLTSVKIGNGVTTIGDNAFEGCKALRSITLEKNVTKIGKKAFYNCKRLKKIHFKTTTLKSVGSKAFKNINKNYKVKVKKKYGKKYMKLTKGKIG